MPTTVASRRRRRRFVAVAPAPAPAEPTVVRSARPDGEWDDYVRGCPHGSPFHEVAWLEAVADGYAHEPHHLQARDRDGRLVGVLPLFHVRGPLTGNALVSVPYAVEGGVLADDDAVQSQLCDAARAEAARLGTRYLELRQGRPLERFENVSHYVGFRRALPRDPDEVLPSLPKKARAAVRKACRDHRLDCRFGHELFDEFHALYVRSLRRLGSPPHGRDFLQRLLDGFGDRCLLQIAYADGTPVAGVMSFRFGGRMLPYYAGIDDRFARMNTSNFVYCRLMERAVELGDHVFDFGRTRKDNKGGCRFKEHQGFEPEEMTYAWYSPSDQDPPDLRPSNPKFAAARRLWTHLPLPVVSAIGGAVSRWIP